VSDLTRVRDRLIADLQKKKPQAGIGTARVMRIVRAAGKIKKIKKRLKKI
jgi:hypothetical protein